MSSTAGARDERAPDTAAIIGGMSRSEPSPPASSAGTITDENSVRLRGRLAADPTVRTLPSGDELCSFRITVARPPGERVRVDTIDCATLRSRVRRTLEGSAPGDRLEVSGRLRRRFWRAPGGLSSRYEVLVEAARVTSRQRPPRRRSDG